jgi:hypothetical protein
MSAFARIVLRLHPFAARAFLAGRFRSIPNRFRLVVVYTIATSRIYSRHVCGIRISHSIRFDSTRPSIRDRLCELARRFAFAPPSRNFVYMHHLALFDTCTSSGYRPIRQNGLGRTLTHISYPPAQFSYRGLPTPFHISRLSVQFLRKFPPSYVYSCMRAIDSMCFPSPSPLIVHPCFFRSSFIPCRTLSLPLASWCAPPPRIRTFLSPRPKHITHCFLCSSRFCNVKPCRSFPFDSRLRPLLVASGKARGPFEFLVCESSYEHGGVGGVARTGTLEFDAVPERLDAVRARLGSRVGAVPLSVVVLLHGHHELLLFLQLLVIRVLGLGFCHRLRRELVRFAGKAGVAFTRCGLIVSLILVEARALLVFGQDAEPPQGSLRSVQSRVDRGAGALRRDESAQGADPRSDRECPSEGVQDGREGRHGTREGVERREDEHRDEVSYGVEQEEDPGRELDEEEPGQGEERGDEVGEEEAQGVLDRVGEERA